MAKFLLQNHCIWVILMMIVPSMYQSLLFAYFRHILDFIVLTEEHFLTFARATAAFEQAEMTDFAADQQDRDKLCKLQTPTKSIMPTEL